MKEQFINVLNKTNPAILKNESKDLIDENIIESLDIMNLVAELEETFEIEFEPEDISPENFSTVAAIEALVNLRIEETK